MNKLILTTMLVGTFAFTACQAKTSETSTDAPVGVKVEKMSSDTMAEPKVTTYTKAQYMEACEVAMTTAQCECYVDFYKSIGLKVTELGDAKKVQEAVIKMDPSKAADMAKCM